MKYEIKLNFLESVEEIVYKDIKSSFEGKCGEIF